MRCKVCRKRFTPTKEMHYIAKETSRDSLLSPVKVEYIDCIDCPYCGRQHMLGIRVPRLKSEVQDDAEAKP